MTSKVFLTGATGYIGSSVLAGLLETQRYDITALVRSEEKAKTLRAHGVKTLLGSLESHDLIEAAAFEADLVVETADCDNLGSSKAMVAGLRRKLRETGQRGRLLQTSGTGMLNDGANGMYLAKDIYSDLDTEKLNALPESQPHRHVDTFLIRHSDEYDLALICPPCIYGYSVGPQNPAVGNPNSIQVPIVIKTALAQRQVVQIGEGLNAWSNVHVADLIKLYVLVAGKLVDRTLKQMGAEGYYFATTGEHTWGAIAEALVPIMKSAGYIDTTEIRKLKEDGEIQAAYGLEPSLARNLCSGNSRSRSEKSRQLGWAPERDEHAIWEFLKETTKSIHEAHAY